MHPTAARYADRMTKQEFLVGCVGLVLFAVMIVMATMGSKLWLIPMVGIFGCSGTIVYERRMR